MADYGILVIFVFNCFPVLLDVVIGVPKYVYWYSVFEEVMTEPLTCVIYNTYIIITMFVMKSYATKAQDRSKTHVMRDIELPYWRNSYVDLLFILAPIIVAVFVYGSSLFTVYTSLSGRGATGSISTLINQLILLAVFLYTSRFFSKNRKAYEYFPLMLLFFVYAWINGKRYIIITMLEALIFMYQMKKENTGRRVNLMVVGSVVLSFMVVFSVFYLSRIRVSTATDYMYGTLRVDFGRDDVTKYVIDRVLIKGQDIVEYPGQTFLSALLMFVPRSIWPQKPYPHYRYLTASILNLDILNLPAGTTPSLFEMSICNFGWLGCFLTPMILVGICRLGDRSGDRGIKLLFLLLLTNFLTQALDSMIVLLLVLIFSLLCSKVRFTLRRRYSV